MRYVFSLLLGTAIVGLFIVLIHILTGSMPYLVNEGQSILLNILLTSIPFLVLSLVKRTNVASWAIAVILSLALWGLATSAVIASREEGSGTDIGLGFILYFGPIVIAMLSFAIGRPKAKV